MNRDHLEQQLPTGVEASTVIRINPTDIKLGRGPTRYDNPGNRVLRQLVKEHVVHYRNDATRKQKAALVKSLISELEVTGYRFIHQSETGTWDEAPPRIVRSRVAHSLRNARLAATKNSGGVNLLPRNFRLATAEQRTSGLVADPLLSGESNISKEMRGKTSDNSAVIDNTLRPGFLLADEGSQEGEVPFFVTENEEHSEHLEMDCHVDNISELIPLGLPSPLEMEPRLEHWERCLDGIEDPAYDAQHLDDMGMASRVDASVHGQSFCNSFSDDPYLACIFEEDRSELRFISDIF